MVWGMVSPSTFGDFFPDGDYVGWEEDLSDFFDNTMPAEQKVLFDDVSLYIFYVSQNFKNEPGVRRSGLPPFGPIAAHEAPKRFETEKSYSSLGSLIKLTSQILAVDEFLKDLIEGIEPNTHHFFPIEIVMPRKRIYPKKYFVMAIGQYLDSFSPEQSDPASWRRNGVRHYIIEETKKAMSGIALSKRALGSAHLWRERSITNPLVCFSDQFKSEIDR